MARFIKIATRLRLVDDLKMLKITMSNTSSRNKLNLEINDHYNIFTGECQKDELKTKDKAFPKKTAWEQFSSNIATAVICLATNRKFNFSRMIFEHMVSNISSPHKFLMYPRFIQICLDMQRHQFQQHTRTYLVPSFSIKVFNNMKRPTKGYSGQEVALFPTMIDVTAPSTSPSRITSSPSHSPEHSPSPTPSPSPEPSLAHTTADVTQPSPTQPSPTQRLPNNHHATQTGILEHHLPTPHDSPLHAVHSHGSDEGSLKLNELTVLDLQHSDRPYGALRMIKEDKAPYNDEDLEDDSSQNSGGKLSDWQRFCGKKASMTLNYVFKESDSTESFKIKRGAVRVESSVMKLVLLVTKKRAQISKESDCKTMDDEEERKRAMDEAKSTKKIDWKDPSVIRYHTLKMKPKTVAQARRNMIKYLKNQGNYKIKHGSGKQKSPEMSPEKSPEKMKSAEKMEEDDVAKETGAKRKKSIPRKSNMESKKTFMYYQVFIGDDSSKNYKILSEMLEDFDRLDVEELYRLVKERYSASRPEGFV
ncbi:hypothetical protein Tco_0561915 [Tanacetum coccineum]